MNEWKKSEVLHGKGRSAQWAPAPWASRQRGARRSESLV